MSRYTNVRRVLAGRGRCKMQVQGLRSGFGAGLGAVPMARAGGTAVRGGGVGALWALAAGAAARGGGGGARSAGGCI